MFFFFSKKKAEEEFCTVLGGGELFIRGCVYYRGIYPIYTPSRFFDVPFLSPRLYQFNSIRLGNSIHWVRTDTVNAKLNTDIKLFPPVNFGSWEITLEGEKSILTYRICTDPGGDIPHWIVSQANQRYLPQMLEDIEAFAGSKFPHAP